MPKKRPPIQFNDEQLLLQASNVADIYHQLALDLFDNVVERVTERGTVYLDKQPYIWQLEKMQQMHLLNEENLKLISKYSGVAEEQLRHIVENEGLKLYTDTKQQLMEDLGRGSAGNSNHIQEILADYANQAIGDLHNLINTTLPKAVIGAYQGIVEQSVARVVTGLSTADKAISDTVMKWQEKGFQGFKDSAGRNWKVDNYARTVIKTTTYRTFREMRTRPAEELGIDTFYFSKKASARKMCAPLQHQIVTTGHARTEHGEKILALSDYGYGRPEGCLGINCGHMLTPFIPGANYKPDLGEDVAEVTPEQAEENANAEAKQRALERSIRANKEKLHVAEKLGDKELIDKYKSKIGTQNAALKEHISQHPSLKRDEEREKYQNNSHIQQEIPDTKIKKIPIVEKTNVLKLPKGIQKTLYDYTNGEFQEICDYSQYITDEKQFKPTYMWHGEKGELKKITDKTKADVKAIHDLINKQPLEKDKLIRFEKLRSGDYSDYQVGDTLNFGIRSATRDKEFIEKLEQDRVVGFETKKRGLNSRKNVKFIFNSSKSLDVSNISEYPDQLEELIQGSYKIVDTKFVEGKNAGWEYIDMPMAQYVKENNLKTEIRTSKKGNKNIVIHMPTGKERLYPIEKWESGTVRYTEEFYNFEGKMERLEVYLEYVNDKKRS